MSGLAFGAVFTLEGGAKNEYFLGIPLMELKLSK